MKIVFERHKKVNLHLKLFTFIHLLILKIKLKMILQIQVNYSDFHKFDLKSNKNALTKDGSYYLAHLSGTVSDTTSKWRPKQT